MLAKKETATFLPTPNKEKLDVIDRKLESTKEKMNHNV